MSTTEMKTELRGTILPVSGQRVVLCAASGTEDLLLLEGRESDLALALALVNRLVRAADTEAPEGKPADWSHLTASDLDVLMLRLRQGMLGARVQADVPCSGAGCGCRIDISFEIDAYIAHHFPRDAGAKNLRAIPIAEQPGWFHPVFAKVGKKTSVAHAASHRHRAMAPTEKICFRLPTIADLLTLTHGPDPSRDLAQRCIRPSDISGRERRHVEAAMEAMAPSLSHDLQGVCPDCGVKVTVYFDARRYCLRELKDRSAFVYQDIDVLARRYHWAEADILAMPRNRRMNYAEFARQEVER